MFFFCDVHVCAFIYVFIHSIFINKSKHGDLYLFYFLPMSFLINKQQTNNPPLTMTNIHTFKTITSKLRLSVRRMMNNIKWPFAT